MIPLGSSDNLQLVSTINADIQVSAIVAEAIGQRERVSEKVTFSFIPSFYLMTSELHLSNIQPKAVIKLSANDKVLKDLKVCVDLKV